MKPLEWSLSFRPVRKNKTKALEQLTQPGLEKVFIEFILHPRSSFTGKD